MEEIEITFALDDKELTFPCSKEDKMKDICQKYADTSEENIDSLLFYYKEKELNLESTLKDIANTPDMPNEQIKIKVNKNTTENIIIEIKPYIEVDNLQRFEEYKKNCGDELYKEYIPETNELVYEGGYSDGKWNGIGKKYCQGKLEYLGDFVNNERNGRGEEYNKKGEIKFKGEYLNGKKWNGIGYDDYGKEEYELIEGKGEVKEYDFVKNYLRFDGEYLNGERSGKGKEYNERKELIFEGEYLNGKRWNGKRNKYYNNKLMSQGEYLNGLETGKEYNYKGELLFEGEYKDGY